MHIKPPTLSGRRDFIKVGIIGTATLACAGGAFRWFAGGYSSQLAPTDKPIALSEKEFVVVKSIVQALLPAVDGFPSGESVGIPQRIDEEVWAASPKVRGDLKDALQVFEHAPLLQGRMSRFSSLSVEDRLECLTEFYQGSNDILQQVAGAFRQMAHFFYYAHPDVWPSISYEGPFIQVPQPPASHIAYAELLKKARGV